MDARAQRPFSGREGGTCRNLARPKVPERFRIEVLGHYQRHTVGHRRPRCGTHLRAAAPLLHHGAVKLLPLSLWAG